MSGYKLNYKPAVTAHGAMASTSHYLASETAIAILKSGGNAMDAAVAACAVQCVVEPQSTGLGGDCFCLYSPKGSDDYIAYNGSGRAAGEATADWYAKQGIDKINLQSPHAVTIPGAVDAWTRLIKDHGRLSLKEILKPAIDLARDGYAIAPRVAFDMSLNIDTLKACANAAQVFLKDGKSLATGTIHHQPKLATSLEKIATHGRDGFYKGGIAEDIVAYLQSRGGLQTMDDFAAAQGEYVTPISVNYKGYQIYQCPPNGQGIIALMLLKIMERFDVKDTDPLNFERIHREIEAGRLAYHQRDAYLCDPDHHQMPSDKMLSDENIDRMFNMIKSNEKIEILPDFNLNEHKDTVYITVVDEERNCCSFINTLFHNFGTGLMAPKSGIMLHNRGAGFSLDPSHPNVISPYKRPLHTIIPAMVASGGRTIMSYGVMGGSYQAFGHMQFLTRFLDYGCDIQQAQDLPRFFPDINLGELEIEGSFNNEIITKLKNMGHNPRITQRPIGGSQAIHINWQNNILTAGSDPRKDGCALGY